jgi:[protein-PII] uridylyltransferase
VAVFYVKDVFGMKVENERKLYQLRQALLAALTPTAEDPPPASSRHVTAA